MPTLTQHGPFVIFPRRFSFFLSFVFLFAAAGAPVFLFVQRSAFLLWAGLMIFGWLFAPVLHAQEPASPVLFSPPLIEADSFDSEVVFEFNLLQRQPTSFEKTTWFGKVRSDYQNFYDRQTLTWLAGGVGLHAAISNTHVDEWLRHEYQEKIRTSGTDEWTELFHSSKIFGEGKYLLPAYAAFALAALPFEKDSLIGVSGEWGERSLRTILVGAPPMLGLQLLIGASRPTEAHSQSHWEPFNDNNGVSGHAFMGAIPFLSAAKMTKHRGLKTMYYLGSVMPALSRVNDDAHYASQALLGWSIAYLASSGVAETYNLPYAPSLMPGPVADGTGFNLLWKF